MKKVFLSALLSALLLSGIGVGCAPAAKQDGDGRAHKVGEKEVINGENYILSFIDDFDGDSLDETKWERCPEWERADRGGKWSGKESNLSGDGRLILTTSYDKEAGICRSGAIRSKDLFEQAYGYFEASIKVQQVPGFWSAFWLMCPEQGNIGNGGKDGCEIDIMEAYNCNDKMINHALHWDGYDMFHESAGKNECLDLYDGEFHTYALKWTHDRYYFYVDGELMWDTDEGGISEVPCYLKLTLEVGSWAGEIDVSTLPASVEVDYVRVYEFDD